MIARKSILSALLAAGCVAGASAQGYYDDDIYYDASKDAQKTKAENAAYKKNRELLRQQQLEQQQLEQQRQFEELYNAYYGNYDPTIGGHDFAGADTYTPDATGSMRDVDEYNRQGRYARQDTLRQSPQGQTDDFAYTRRIERFHNADIVAAFNDPGFREYYYSQTAKPEVNIYVNAGPSWYSPWGWNSWDWYWGSPYYYSSWWGPSWSWSWGWAGPGWSWNWGWGPSWAWGPSWSWGWGPGWGWGGNHWAWHNSDRYTPNGRRPLGPGHGYTGSTGYRPNLTNNMNGRPGRGGYTVSPSQVGNYRPGSSAGNASGTYRPAQGTSRPSYGGNSGSYGRTSGSRDNRGSSYNYNQGSSSRSSQSWGGYSGGSSSRGSSGGFGGGNSGGGGSHRGGRR